MPPLKKTKPSTTNSSKSEGRPPRRPRVLFTDLDGTLLSAHTYEPGPALAALEICRMEGIAVVLVSSNTRAEIVALRSRFEHREPFVSENGGAIFLPQEAWEKPPGFARDDPFWTLAMGTPHPTLVAVLQRAAARCGATLHGLSSMPLAEVRQRTGLAEPEARLACLREYDEPFLIEDETPLLLQCLERAVVDAGLRLTRGGRFHHILGKCDKGRAVTQLMGLYRQRQADTLFAAVGDAGNDLAMLRAVDRPFLVRRRDGTHDATACFEGVVCTEGIGPEGFAEAVQLFRRGP